MRAVMSIVCGGRAGAKDVCDEGMDTDHAQRMQHTLPCASQIAFATEGKVFLVVKVGISGKIAAGWMHWAADAPTAFAGHIIEVIAGSAVVHGGAIPSPYDQQLVHRAALLGLCSPDSPSRDSTHSRVGVLVDGRQYT